MLNIIKSDLYRIFKSKTTYITLMILAMILTLSVVAMSPGHIGLATSNTETGYDISDKELQEKLNNTNSLTETRKIMLEYGGFPLDKQIIGTNVNLYYFFIEIIVLILVLDLSNSTVKNTLSSAISRKKYYFSKLITCLLLCTGLVLFNNIVSYSLNYFINGSKFTSDILEIIKVTLYQLPMMYGIISLLVSLGFLLKKTSIFNTVTIPLLIGSQLAMIGISSLFRFNASGIMKFDFQYALANLASSPSTTYILQCAGLGLIYIIVFNLIGYLSFKRTEIK